MAVPFVSESPAANDHGLGRLWQSIAALLFPHRCLRCGVLFPPPVELNDVAHREAGLSAERFSHLLAPHFCAACRTGFMALIPPQCPRCGRHYPDRNGADHLCGTCLESPGPIAMARSAGLHDGPLKAAIHNLKYRGKLQLAKPLGSLLLSALQRYWPDGAFDVILAVPLHARRFRQRGFNQTDLLISRGGWPREDDCSHRRSVLLRSRATPPQAGLDRAARRKNIRGAFQVAERGAVEGRRVLLVDDVLTTGATAEECARVLLRAGAAQVDLLTLSRVENR